MNRIYAMGHHYGGYDGDDYDEMCDYADELLKEHEEIRHKVDAIYDKIEGHPEHHRRGYRTYRHREGEYNHREGDYMHRDKDYGMYDEHHRRSYRRGEHHVRGYSVPAHYSR